MFEDPQSRTAGFHPDLRHEPILPGSPKSHRGWAHLETAYLLCPERYLEEFRQDPQYVFLIS